MSRMFSGKEVIRALKKLGYEELYTKGSHVFLYNSDIKIKVVVPKHKELKKGMLHSILKKAGIRLEALKKLV